MGAMRTGRSMREESAALAARSGLSGGGDQAGSPSLPLSGDGRCLRTLAKGLASRHAEPTLFPFLVPEAVPPSLSAVCIDQAAWKANSP